MFSDIKVKNFEAIEDVLLQPLFKIYKDFSQMMLMKLTEDLKKTW